MIDAPKKPPQAHLMSVTQWPEKRTPEGIGLSVKDGWNFGTGFGLAMLIAVPLILSVFGCAIFVSLSVLGGSLGALF
ncbi:MAG: hypothetical protein GY743_23265 [Planctomycetaceae bacterium]|nr:hypothetical protein [Planctomycetaceae bacterium]